MILTPRFKIGLQFTPRGRVRKLCTVTDILTTTNSKGEIVKIRYVAEHEFCGQTVIDCDVCETTIAMSAF